MNLRSEMRLGWNPRPQVRRLHCRAHLRSSNTFLTRSGGSTALVRPSMEALRVDNFTNKIRNLRFYQMRREAERKGKAVPTMNQLYALASNGLSCPDCGVTMHWLEKESPRFVITLQHYRDGSFGLVCKSCNSRHRNMPGDDYRSSPKDHKYCPHCKLLKPFSKFAHDSTRKGTMQLKSWCMECMNAARKKWRRKQLAVSHT